MSKYVTNEETFNCRLCSTRLVWRDLIRSLKADHTLMLYCPCCKGTVGWTNPADDYPEASESQLNFLRTGPTYPQPAGNGSGIFDAAHTLDGFNEIKFLAE